MAKPIKETPILKGNDAIRFNQEIEKSKSQKVSSEVKQRIQSNYLSL